MFHKHLNWKLYILSICALPDWPMISYFPLFPSEGNRISSGLTINKQVCCPGSMSRHNFTLYDKELCSPVTWKDNSCMFLEVSRAAVMLLTVWLNLIQIIYWLKSEFNLAPRCAPTKELLWQRLNRLFLGFVEKFYVYIIGSCLSFAFPTINNSDNLLLDCTVIFNLQLRCWTSTHTATNYNINHSLFDASVLYHINCERW